MGVFMVCFIIFIGLTISCSILYMLFTVGRGIDVNKDSKVKR